MFKNIYSVTSYLICFFRKSLYFTIFLALSLASFVKNQETWCDYINSMHLEFGENVPTCRVPKRVSLSVAGTKFPSPLDSRIKGIEFFGNSKISYLPVNIQESFPNLIRYGAGKCAVKTISKENFEGLTYLRQLLLFENFIKKVPSDVFQGLVSLEFVNLGEMNVK